MCFLKENKFFICILLVTIFVFAFSTIVTSTDIEDDSFIDFEEESKEEKESIAVIDEDDESDDIKTDIDEDTEDESKEDVKTETQNESTNSLSEAGIEDTPGIVIIALFVIVSLYAYIKTKQYNNI